MAARVISLVCHANTTGRILEKMVYIYTCRYCQILPNSLSRVFALGKM